jgi:hypothetical protein
MEGVCVKEKSSTRFNWVFACIDEEWDEHVDDG